MSEVSGAAHDEIVNRMPVTLAGHYVARAAVKHGVEGVERRKDYAAAFKLMDEVMRKTGGAPK